MRILRKHYNPLLSTGQRYVLYNGYKIEALYFFRVIINSVGEQLDESPLTPSASSTCDAGCCENLDAPNQPTDRAVFDLTKQQTGNKSEHRSLKPQWYKGFSWIHLCTDRKKIFCFH